MIEKSDRAGIKQFILHSGLIAACALLILMSGMLTPLFMLVQGILIVFLFTTLHESVHRTPFKSKFLNVRVGQLCGFLVFLGPEWFRYFHFEHHRHTNIVGKDPELSSPKPETLSRYLIHLSGLPETLSRLRALLSNAFLENTDNYVPQAGKPKVMQEARVQLAAYGLLAVISVFTNSSVLLSIWIIPFIIAGPFLRAYLLAEHAHCPHVSSMLENTRTTFTNRIVRFIAWNMPYHVEHHANPAVPFHKLPQFHEHTKAHILHTSNGYGQFSKNYLKNAKRASFSDEYPSN